jgi:hypothetical protein
VSMLTPLSTYTPQIIDECYSYSSSPEPATTVFAHNMDKSSYLPSGRLTPQTPDSFSFNNSLPMSDSFDHYMHPQGWPHEGSMPMGLGFESEIPNMMPMETDMRVWTPDFAAHSTPGPHTHGYNPPMCDSPASVNLWPAPIMSVSPSQPPHTRGVPSLSISECSAPESDSPDGAQEEWPSFQGLSNSMCATKPVTSTPYLDSIKTLPMETRAWEDGVLSRSSTF